MTFAKQHLFFFKKKKKKPRGRRSHAREVEYSQTARSHCLIAIKRATLLSEPMSLLTPQQSRTKSLSGQEMTSLDSSGSIQCDWQRQVGPPGTPGRRGYVRGKEVNVKLRTIWVVLAEIATSLYSSGSLGSGAGALRVYTHVAGFQQAGCGSQGHMSGCKASWE